jgi:XTP/dITP diphosphohydrolase
MTKTLLLATKDDATLAELRDLLADRGFRLLDLRAIGDPPRIMRSGLTDVEHVLHAARACARWAGLPALVERSWIDIWPIMARYRCLLALAWPNGRAIWCEGRIYGDVRDASRESSGCDLDRIFYYPPLDKTLAELSQEERRIISPRAQAVSTLLLMLSHDRPDAPHHRQISCPDWHTPAP